MSYRKYAEHRGCSLRAVQKAVGDVDAKGRRTGRIAGALEPVPGSPHPKIDSDKADALWALNTDEAKRSTLFTPSVAATPGVPGGEADLKGEPEEPSDPETEATKKSYHEARAKREEINTEVAQLDLDERKGRLIDLEDAKQIGFTTLRALRDALRNTGARISAQLAATSEPFECEQLVNAEIDAALASVTVEKILAEQNDDELEEGLQPGGA